MRSHRITIRHFAADPSAQCERAMLIVSDDGPGMTAVDAENALHRFYRGASRGESEGSGLGLSIGARR